MKVTFPARPRCERAAIDVELRYDSTDPYAVSIVFLPETRMPKWFFSRELLRDGLSRMAGDGDVRINPGPLTVAIRLESPSGKALLVFARDDVTVFLRTTYHAVADGAEDEHVNWSEVDRILEGGAA